MSVKRYEWVACDEHSCHCDVVESAEGDMVDYEDYAALEARCAALAAENAVLKTAHPQPFGPEMMKALDAYEKHQDDVPETGMLDAFFILRDSIRVDTKATDSFLAEVRASAIDSLVDIKTKQLADMHPDTHAFGATAMSIRSQINELQMLAAMLHGAERVTSAYKLPDGWVACSDRMPDEGSKVIVFRPRADESNDPPVKTATYKGGREYYHGFDCYCEPTHWMPLPAAPQQEVK